MLGFHYDHIWYSYHMRFLFYSSAVACRFFSGSTTGGRNVFKSHSPSPNNRLVPVPYCPRISSFSRGVSSCSSLVRGCQKRGTPKSSSHPTSGTFSQCTDSRPGVNETDASGSTSSFPDKSTINPSWSEQIEGALRVQRLELQQVNSCRYMYSPHLTAGRVWRVL